MFCQKRLEQPTRKVQISRIARILVLFAMKQPLHAASTLLDLPLKRRGGLTSFEEGKEHAATWQQHSTAMLLDSLETICTLGCDQSDQGNSAPFQMIGTRLLEPSPSRRDWPPDCMT